MTILIADSGSTKTEWLLLIPSQAPLRFASAGLNPCLMDDATITALLSAEAAPHLCGSLVDALYFYGAGCRPDQLDRMKALLAAALSLPATARIAVASDLLGAAHALCGCSPGIVAILGTGSGSALYDGHSFVCQTPSLGYILGDEGSGAVLGRRLVSDLYKGALPHSLLSAFEADNKLNLSDIVHHVYSLPSPNRYLAQFTHFLSAHSDEPAIRALLVDEFRRFFVRNIVPYDHPALPIHFVGSIASIFEAQLREAALTAVPDAPFTVGRILASPIAALGEFRSVHQN